MTWTLVRRSLLVALVTAVQGALLPAQSPEPISANDNRRPAGELRNHVLTLRLEMRKGVWYPERDNGEAIPVYAFGEAGKPLQVPGPLVRVPQGTTIEIALQNSLPVAATLHGLHQRPGDDKNVVTMAPGATQQVTFVAGVPGTYLYWARTPDGQRGANRVNDSLLGGAFVVDAPGAPAGDRVFVLERWNGPTRTAINGKSWPFTERLNYTVGERIHWRVVNASDLSHPMHLHGSHFNVDAMGDGEHYQMYDAAATRLVFTQTAEIGETFEMTWTPKEPGRWLYHCHRLPHMRIPVALDPGDAIVNVSHEHSHDDAEYAGMGGMIMGITVTGRGPEIPADTWKRARKLELEVASRNGDPQFFQLAVHAPGETATRAKGNISPGLMGPPIILTQNQPVEIAVINKLRESTAVHWHGIELESYYDGVPGWGGLDERKSPAIEPGQTFVARMMPPRAGTFIYHTHWHDNTQLVGGVHGPLIVMPPGKTYDAATDKAFLFSQGPNDPYGAALLLMNGVPQPVTLQLRAETKYRFRFINITPSVANLRVSLKKNGTPVEWRPVAKDTVDLPPTTPMKTAELQVSVSETYDFEYEADVPQELTLEGIQPNDNRRVVQTLIFAAPQAGPR